MIAALFQEAVPEPLPELSLGGPELLAIPANDQRGSFLPSQLFSLLSFCFLLLFIWRHDVASSRSEILTLHRVRSQPECWSGAR